MKKIFIVLCTIALLASNVACTDDDTFSTSSSDLLTFSVDTVDMDTVFSTVPTSTRTFWVYNKSGNGIRCTNVRLANGNQTGFRVNVDGEYLSPTYGYQVQNVEIRKQDSIRVFVELTSPVNGVDGPQLLEDNLIFTLESGVEQKVNLNAHTWDATLMRDFVVSKDTTIDGTRKPIVIYGGMKVDSMVTLKIAAGTTLYFHGDAGIDVYGRLLAEGTAEANVVLRGDRTDWMFDYLPKEIGAIIHRDTLTVDLLGKRFFLGHGDEVDFRSKAFRLIRAIFRNKFCQWLYAGIHPRWTFGFALGWSLNSRKSGLEKQEAKKYQGEDAEYMVVFAKEYLKTHPDINFFIFGHRHIMLDLMLSRTSRILIAGDWMQFFSYIVWDGENLYMDQFLEETDGQSYPNT